MATHSRPCARCDFLFRRGGDMTVAVRWKRDSGSGYEPVDLTIWEATFALEDPFGETLAEIECTCTSDGFALAPVPAETWELPALAGITRGPWRLVGTDGDQARVLGTGYWEVS